MKKQEILYTAKLLIIFLIVSFMVDKIIFYSLNRISDEVMSGQSIGKLNHFLKIKEKQDLLIFGSSRANHHINPKVIMENGFNMGVDGRNLAYISTLVNTLNSKKQILLIQLDPSYAFSKNYDGSDVDALIVKYNRNDIIKQEIDRLHQNNIMQNVYWSIGYNGKVLGIIKNYFKPNYDYRTYSGYDPISVTYEQKQIFKKSLENRKDDPCEETFEFNSIYEYYLDELRKFSKANNKTLVFFTSPVYADKCKSDNIQFAKIMSEMDLTYFDYSDFFNQNNDFKYWKDFTHLSGEGAKIFTEEIKKMVEELN